MSGGSEPLVSLAAEHNRWIRMAEQLAQTPPHSNPSILDEPIPKKTSCVDATSSVIRTSLLQDTDDPMELSRSFLMAMNLVAKPNLLRLSEYNRLVTDQYESLSHCSSCKESVFTNVSEQSWL